MRCERCKFENIPGQLTCVKCGSTLQLESGVLDIYPPRMPKWEKWFRSLSRSIRRNRLTIFLNAQLRTPQWLRDLLNDDSLGLLLCLVPGLAHLLHKRFREVRLYLAAWFVLLFTGLFLFGDTPGYVCLGLAIGVHVGIAIQYGLFSHLDNFRERAAMAILLLMGLLFLYLFIPNLIFPSLTGGHSTLTIPYYNISEGDYLLARGNIDADSVLPRGSVVLIHPAAVGGGHWNGPIFNQGTTFAQIVGLPGENVRMVGNTFVVNNKKLDLEHYPVPGWLQRTSFSFIIPDDSYFVSAQYVVGGHGVQLTEGYIRQVCIVDRSDVQARVFMRWLPLSKRGFLR